MNITSIIKKHRKIWGLLATVIMVVIVALVVSRFMLPKGKMVTKRYVSVYEKLADGADINVLIVGDSIAAGTGASNGNSWAARLPEYIRSTYESECNITNVSLGGNTSYAGTYKVKELDDMIDYDLAIICYGENDNDDERFAPEYEAIIRAIQIKYPRCRIISVLESSQREYTNKMNTIMEIAGHYGIPVADTIKSFNKSGYDYEDLVHAPDDLTHPNDQGHEIYLETIGDVINEQVRGEMETYSADAYQYDCAICYERSDFRRVGLRKFAIALEEPVTAASIGVYRTYMPGENGLKIYADGELIYENSFIWNYGFGQEHIDKIVEEPVSIEKKIEVEFSSMRLAKYFRGIMINIK